MTRVQCTRGWPLLEWDWCTNAPDSAGFMLDQRFAAWAAAVNANPGKEQHQIEVIRDHGSSTDGLRHGFVWKLGHPDSAQVFGFHNITAEPNRFSSGRYFARFWSDYTNDTSNGGYGSVSTGNTNACLQHWGQNMTLHLNYGPSVDTDIRIIAEDDPGAEFFLLCIYQTAEVLIVLVHWSEALQAWVSHRMQRGNSSVQSSSVRNGVVTVNPAVLTLFDQLQSTELGACNYLMHPGYLRFGYSANVLNTISPLYSRWPLTLLPEPFWVGYVDQYGGNRRRFVLPEVPNGLYQLLGKGSATFPVHGWDLWYEAPEPASVVVPPGWFPLDEPLWAWTASPVGEPLDIFRAPYGDQPEIFTISGATIEGLHEFDVDVLGAAGVLQNPLYRRQLQAAGGGGGGGSSRPATGVLYPRRPD